MTFLIHKATGEQVSHTTIWKLANGQAQNPSKHLIERLARTFGVPPAFFFDDYDEEQLGLLKDQVELLALIRDAKITSAEFRALLGAERRWPQGSCGCHRADRACRSGTARRRSRRNPR